MRGALLLKPLLGINRNGVGVGYWKHIALDPDSSLIYRRSRGADMSHACFGAAEDINSDLRVSGVVICSNVGECG